MAKRDDQTESPTSDATTTGAAGSTTGDAMEQRVIAFAEQLGRIAGTVQGRAEGWMDRSSLTTQISSVRDAASELLDQLVGGATKVAKASKSKMSGISRISKLSRVSKARPAAAAPRAARKGRSGGVVDAPGKKHRAPAPEGPDKAIARTLAAKMRGAKTMVAATRRRGRG
jgi:hypothetical protein